MFDILHPHSISQRAAGADWREISPTLFGSGSYGNGAAMRAAPIGGYFSGNPRRAAKEAQLSAVVTHAHPEGQAGAIAVAAVANKESLSFSSYQDIISLTITGSKYFTRSF